MIHLTRARRGAVLTILALFLSTLAVVGGATAANAAACTGKITNLWSSRSAIAYRLSSGDSFGVLPGETRLGTVANPINAFWIPSSSRVQYYDLPRNEAYLDTHYPDYQGSYWVNPCHYAKVLVY